MYTQTFLLYHDFITLSLNFMDIIHAFFDIGMIADCERMIPAHSFRTITFRLHIDSSTRNCYTGLEPT